MDLSKIQSPVVFYHASCRDGWCAAFLAKRRWTDAELVSVQHGDPVVVDGTPLVTLRADGEPKSFDLQGRDVLILDFSFRRDVLLLMKDVARSLLVLDHHATAEQDLKGLDFCVFDMERSGCGLALDAFFPGRRTEADDWIRDVAVRCEDADLWRYAFDDTREVCAYLDTVDRSVTSWESLPRLRDMRERGAAVLSYQRQQVERIAEKSRHVLWNGIRASVVNSPVLQSEVGEALYERDPSRVALVWYQNEAGDVVCSLRSKKGVGEDVSSIARKHGGGGHRHAAGFKVRGLGTDGLPA